jgi:2'-5' RNA ligase
MGERLFAALSPSAAAVEHLEAAVVAQRDAEQRVEEPRLRWTRPQLWHLTLAFFGDLGARPAADLGRRLARAAARHEPMELRFRGAGAFSRPASASVLWAGVEGPLGPLGSLAASCAAAGRRVGVGVNDLPYRPHLTLARAKGRAPVDVRALVEALAAYVGPSWPASELHLMASHLGPQPHYDVVGTWQLGPSAGVPSSYQA